MFSFNFQGVSKESGEEVAIKTFALNMNTYVQREADTIATADHENVVKFFALEEQLNILAHKKVLIMEYCSGGNLQQLIDSESIGLCQCEFLRVCQNLMSAVQHLRKKNIIHRDIKPLNILVSKQSDENTVYKLGDFGSARTLKENESYGSLYGTYEYIHPDIFAKFFAHALNIFPPTQYFNDVHELWSIGVTLFEAATGRLPFKPENGRADKDKMYKMISQKPNGHISANEINGKIEWSQTLPEDCALDHSLKQHITSFLAGLLNVSRQFPCRTIYIIFQIENVRYIAIFSPSNS